jgi:hypothetical protein
VLWNNAGVMIPPQGSKTKQGYELQLGTNNVAPFLFTKLLTPILIKTAKLEPPGTVRVVWTSSGMAEAGSPKNGVDMSNLNYKTDKSAWQKYSVSKAGNILHSKEFANRYAGDGLISVVSEVVVSSTARLFLVLTLLCATSLSTPETSKLPFNDMSLVGKWLFSIRCYIPQSTAHTRSYSLVCHRMLRRIIMELGSYHGDV